MNSLLIAALMILGAVIAAGVFTMLARKQMAHPPDDLELFLGFLLWEIILILLMVMLGVIIETIRQVPCPPQ